MKYLFLFLCLVLSITSLASEEKDSLDLNVAFEKINEAMELKNKQTPNQRAEFFYETAVDEKKVCGHCPQYLNLIKEVNKIVEKLPTPKDVSRANEQLIQVDRLKFMYYETAAANMFGSETCSIFSNMEPTMIDGIKRDKLTTLAEELISLPQVTTIQYYPNPPEKEVRYLYRGEGLQSHIIIEVIVKADKTAIVRYHHYDPYDLPNIGGSLVEKTRKLNELETNTSVRSNLQVDTKTVVNLNDQSAQATLKGESSEWIKIEARHKNESEASIKAILPLEVTLPTQSGMRVSGTLTHEQKENLATDEHSKLESAKLNLGNDKNTKLLSAQIETIEDNKTVVLGSNYQVKVVDDLKVRAEVEQTETERMDEKSRVQKMGLTFSNDKGTHEYVSAAVNKSDEKETILLSTKHQWEIGDSEKGMRIKGEASQTTIDYQTDNKSRSHEMVLSLTDRNHEYVTARVVQGDDLDRLIALSSRYAVGDLGTVNATVNRYDSGKESVAFGHQVNSGKNSFQTNIGHDSEAGQFINLKAERKISSTASMILTVQADSNKETSFMYQYQAKF